jgi:hypothetical protein
MQTIFSVILAGLATYYETYHRSIPLAAARLATAPKYILFPEQRAKKVGDSIRNSTIKLTFFLLVCCDLS